jgi:hypothetical protein
MSIIKLEEVYLYTSDVTENSTENIEAKAFMDHSTIPYKTLIYNNIEHTVEVMNSVNTWWNTGNPTMQREPLTKYPFLVYTEVHDDIPARFSPVKALEGLESIKTFPALYDSIMNPISNT